MPIRGPAFLNPLYSDSQVDNSDARAQGVEQTRRRWHAQRANRRRAAAHANAHYHFSGRGSQEYGGRSQSLDATWLWLNTSEHERGGGHRDSERWAGGRQAEWGWGSAYRPEQACELSATRQVGVASDALGPNPLAPCNRRQHETWGMEHEPLGQSVNSNVGRMSGGSAFPHGAGLSGDWGRPNGAPAFPAGDGRLRSGDLDYHAHLHHSFRDPRLGHQAIYSDSSVGTSHAPYPTHHGRQMSRQLPIDDPLHRIHHQMIAMNRLCDGETRPNRPRSSLHRVRHGRRSQDLDREQRQRCSQWMRFGTFDMACLDEENQEPRPGRNRPRRGNRTSSTLNPFAPSFNPEAVLVALRQELADLLSRPTPSNGALSHGLTPDDFSSIKGLVVGVDIGLDDLERLVNDRRCCSICWNKFEIGDEAKQLPCSEIHIFHKDCIWTWLKQKATCPICREDVKKAVRLMRAQELRRTVEDRKKSSKSRHRASENRGEASAVGSSSSRNETSRNNLCGDYDMEQARAGLDNLSVDRERRESEADRRFRHAAIRAGRTDSTVRYFGRRATRVSAGHRMDRRVWSPTSEMEENSVEDVDFQSNRLTRSTLTELNQLRDDESGEDTLLFRYLNNLTELTRAVRQTLDVWADAEVGVAPLSVRPSALGRNEGGTSATRLQQPSERTQEHRRRNMLT